MREQMESGLRKLFLHAMAREYAAVAKAHEKANASYEKYLSAMVELELREKERLRYQRLIKEARIPLVKLLAEYDFTQREGISSQEVARLCQGDFIRDASNVVLYGSFGLGKSHLAMAITRSLCEKGFKCLYMSTAAFINELCVAQKNLALSTLFKKLDRFDLIALDELGYTPQTPEGADLFFQLISQRYERKSLLITTNLVYSEWNKVFLSEASTAAAVDRIIHKCETFNIKGPSWRAEMAKKNILRKTQILLNQDTN